MKPAQAGFACVAANFIRRYTKERDLRKISVADRELIHHTRSQSEISMLMLLFYIGDERYAIRCREVVEVVPMVALKKLYQAPDYVAGLFNYRGALVPALDVCQRINGSLCRPHLSTRIIIVNYLGSDFQAQEGSRTTTARLLGLIAERVTETINKPETELVEPEIAVNAAPFLGKLIVDEKGMIQCIRLEYLLPSSQQDYLLLPPEEENSTL